MSGEGGEKQHAYDADRQREGARLHTIIAASSPTTPMIRNLPKADRSRFVVKP